MMVVWIPGMPVSTLSGAAVISFTFGVEVLHLSMPFYMYLLECVLSYLFIFFLLT